MKTISPSFLFSLPYALRFTAGVILALFAAEYQNSARADECPRASFRAEKISTMILGGNGATPVPRDYDGDRLADPAVFLETNGQWRVALSGAGYQEATAAGWGRVGCQPVPADYDGDGQADPAVYLAAGGVWCAWLSGSAYLSVMATNWGGPGFSPVPADYDGDGRADPAVYLATNGTWQVWLSSCGYPPVSVANWGGAAWTAAPTDYDGDRRCDPAGWSGTLTTWRAWPSASGYQAAELSGIGAAGASPFPADYDGDGKADPALYTGATGNWTIFPSGSGYLATNLVFGGAGYQPVPGDYDGSGASDLAVYQALTGLWLFSPAAVSGRVFYVATTGNDANDGSAASPWATPGHGSRQLQPGDTLIIMGGTYAVSVYDQDDIVPPSGTVSAWVTIRGQTGQRPKIEGRQGLRAAIDIGGKSYVRIENLELTSAIDNPYTGGLGQGVEAGGSAGGAGDISNVVLQDLYIHHIEEGGGINFSGDMQAVQVLDTRIAYCTQSAIAAPASSGRGGWRNVVISNCYLGYSGHFYHGQVHDDQSLYDRPDGIGLEPSDGPVLITHTTAEHNFGDGLDSKSANTTIAHCRVANNSCDGVKLWRSASRILNTLIYGRGDGNPQVTPWAAIVIDSDRTNDVFEIINVTVDDALGQNYAVAIQYDNPAVPLNLTLRNTIFSSRGTNGPVYLAGAITGSVDCCLFYLPNSSAVLVKGNVEYAADQLNLLGAGNLYGDPLFQATGFGAGGDYHTQSGSPAIDHGSAAGAPATDLEDKPRPQGAGYDIGCYDR